jgi:hypothetical protein
MILPSDPPLTKYVTRKGGSADKNKTVLTSLPEKGRISPISHKLINDRKERMRQFLKDMRLAFRELMRLEFFLACHLGPASRRDPLDRYSSILNKIRKTRKTKKYTEGMFLILKAEDFPDAEILEPDPFESDRTGMYEEYL